MGTFSESAAEIQPITEASLTSLPRPAQLAFAALCAREVLELPAPELTVATEDMQTLRDKVVPVMENYFLLDLDEEMKLRRAEHGRVLLEDIIQKKHQTKSGSERVRAFFRTIATGLSAVLDTTPGPAPDAGHDSDTKAEPPAANQLSALVLDAYQSALMASSGLRETEKELAWDWQELQRLVREHQWQDEDLIPEQIYHQLRQQHVPNSSTLTKP